MLVVCYNGVKVHVSFSKACVEWTVLRDFKGEMTVPSGLCVRPQEVRWLEQRTFQGTQTTVLSLTLSGVTDLGSDSDSTTYKHCSL